MPVWKELTLTKVAGAVPVAGRGTAWQSSSLREPLAVYSDPCMPVIQESYGFSIRQIDDRDSILAYWRVPGPRNRGHQLGFMDSDSEFMASSTLR